MALVLGLTQGESFYVLDQRIIVDSIQDAKNFTLKRVDNVATLEGPTFDINDTESTEVMPNCFVCAGKRGDEELARVLIVDEDDRLILREQLYNRTNDDEFEDA